MEHVSCHPSGAYIFEVARIFLENLFTPDTVVTFDQPCLRLMEIEDLFGLSAFAVWDEFSAFHRLSSPSPIIDVIIIGYAGTVFHINLAYGLR
jgi:hypothetical protein